MEGHDSNSILVSFPQKDLKNNSSCPRMAQHSAHLNCGTITFSTYQEGRSILVFRAFFLKVPTVSSLQHFMQQKASKVWQTIQKLLHRRQQAINQHNRHSPVFSMRTSNNKEAQGSFNPQD
uniref:Uncharacterized protein n=1 Tax=Rhizophora mucronata TaxID=61149 RepID=A0A2P2QPJ4_RHIMU